ncbi:MAG: 4Fe-4S dicluster domain-containing protein [Desulfurococcaceae archaeon]
MTRWVMVINRKTCTGCYNCVVACKDEFWGNSYPPYSAPQPKFGHFWMRIEKEERGRWPGLISVAYTPILCMHCEDPPCVKASKGGAAYKRPDGVVIIDPAKSKGQKQIVDSCPYKAVYWNEELQIPQKCTFCAHLIDKGWRRPRCVEACPIDAIAFGDADDPNSEVSRLIAEGKAKPHRPELGLKVNVFYVD